MSKIPDRDSKLSYCRMEYDRAILYANYWMAMATTGAATSRDTSQGRPPTEEEKAQGEVIGWRPHTDQEKINNALETSLVHIDRLPQITQVIVALEQDDPHKYNEAVRRSY